MSPLVALPAEPWPRFAGWLVPGDNCTLLEYRIVLRALHDDGIREHPAGSNRGIRIDRYTRRAGLRPPQYWCGIWAGCVIADAGGLVPQGFPDCDTWLPYCNKVCTPGSAVLYGKPGDARHIGIIVDHRPDDPIISKLSIEGNRSYHDIKSNNGVAVDLAPVARADILGYYHAKPNPKWAAPAAGPGTAVIP